jgi:hypothetical protein
MSNRHLEHCVGEGWGLEEGSGLGDESGMVSKWEWRWEWNGQEGWEWEWNGEWGWEWNVDAGWEYFQPPGRAGLERHNPALGP